MSDLISILEKSQLLSAFPMEYKEQLAGSLCRLEFAKGQQVFGEGDPGDAVYFIEKGAVGVYTTDKALGIDFEIAHLQEGDCFGEMALLTEEPRSATCRASEPSVIYALPCHVFTNLLNTVAQPAAALCKILAKRVAVLDRSKGMQTQSISSFTFDPQVFNMVPPPIINQHKIIPLALVDGTLTVATTNPSNAMGFDAVRRVVRGVRLNPILISEEDYAKFMRHNKSQKATASAVPSQKPVAIQYFSDADDKDDKGQKAGA
jgi:CRP-like cAMP-binding protein